MTKVTIVVVLALIDSLGLLRKPSEAYSRQRLSF